MKIEMGEESFIIRPHAQMVAFAHFPILAISFYSCVLESGAGPWPALDSQKSRCTGPEAIALN